MGFPIKNVEYALKQTKNSGLQPAMDYLIANPNIEPSTETEESSGELEGEGEISQDQSTALSLKCEDCGRFFRDCTDTLCFHC